MISVVQARFQKGTTSKYGFIFFENGKMMNDDGNMKDYIVNKELPDVYGESKKEPYDMFQICTWKIKKLSK